MHSATGKPAARYGSRMAAPDPTDVARKFRQHDNEFEAVYDLLGVVAGKIDTLAGKVDAGFGRLDGRLGTVDSRFDVVDGRLDRIDGRFDQVDGRLDRVDGRLEQLERGQQQILDILIRGGRGGPSSS